MARTVELTSPTITGIMRIWTAFVSDGNKVTSIFVHVYAQEWEFLVGKFGSRAATDRLRWAIERRVDASNQTSFRVALADLDA